MRGVPAILTHRPTPLKTGEKGRFAMTIGLRAPCSTALFTFCSKKIARPDPPLEKCKSTKPDPPPKLAAKVLRVLCAAGLRRSLPFFEQSVTPRLEQKTAAP